MFHELVRTFTELSERLSRKIFADREPVVRPSPLVNSMEKFGFVAFSLMRVRRSFALANPAPNRVFEIVKCKQCTFKQIKNFALGDYVAKTLGLCTQCNTANLFIDGIYGEPPHRK